MKKIIKKPTSVSRSLVDEIRLLINKTRQQVAATVNSSLVALYWHIGKRMHREILKEKRADYGERIVSTLSRQLTVEFGEGFAEKGLRHMIHFAEVFPDEQIVSTLWRQLTWSHFREIIYLKDELHR